MKATWRKSQLRRPPRAHARYSNDREFSTRQHAGKLPSVLKGNRKRIGKKAAQGNAERSGARKAYGRESVIEFARGPHTTRSAGMFLLPARMGEQLHPWRLGARLPYRRLPGGIRARAFRRQHVHTHSRRRGRRGRPVPGRYFGDRLVGCKNRRNRAQLHRGRHRSGTGGSGHHDVRPSRETRANHRD